jgi:uncharacterized membrane protein YtjA (UPF0391 family)
MAGWVPLVFIGGVATAALLGFGGAPAPAAGLGQILFFVSLVALMVSLVLASTRRATD